MMSAAVRLVVVLTTASVLLTSASAQSCPNFIQVDTSGLLDNFTKIEVGLNCPALNNTPSVPIPEAIHWHITPSAGANFSISTSTEGLVIPSVDGGVLSFSYGDAIPWQGGSAGVEIITPSGNLTTITSTGVGYSIKVTDESGSLRSIEDRGVNNAFYVSSAGTSISVTSDAVNGTAEITGAIRFTADSVNGTAEINAPTVNVALGGANGKVAVKGTTYADLRGVNNKLVVEGSVFGTASGVANEVLATDGCDSFTDSGVDNTCEVTDMTTTVSDLACRGPEGTAVCKDDVTVMESSSPRKSISRLAMACCALLLLFC